MVRRDGDLRPRLWLLIIVSVVGLGVGIGFALLANAVASQGDRLAQAELKVELSDLERDELRKGYQALYDQLTEMDEEPIAPPPDESVIPDVDTDVVPVPIRPTDNQVRAVVNDYLIDNPPAPGQTPTDAEIEALFTSFCAERNACQAPPADPLPPLAPLPPVGLTDAQIEAEFAAFCAANNDCRGRTGDTGSQGATGLSCVEEFSFEACRGDPGVQGVQGIQGETGRGFTGTPEFVILEDDTCVFRLFYTDDTTTDTPVPRQFCRRNLLQ